MVEAIKHMSWPARDVATTINGEYREFRREIFGRTTSSGLERKYEIKTVFTEGVTHGTTNIRVIELPPRPMAEVLKEKTGHLLNLAARGAERFIKLL